MINEFIEDICSILNIVPPQISYDTSHFQTETMLAACDNEGRTIFLRRQDSMTPDFYFGIAHELRHVWQIRTESRLLDNYKTSNQCENSEMYNLQPAEVDANAFATMVMADFFHIKPLHDGMSDRVIAQIHKRIEELSANGLFE